MCVIYHNASPYTRSKNSNNHRLYRDTMPLTHISVLRYSITIVMLLCLLILKVPSDCHSLASNLYSDIGDDAKLDGKLVTEELNRKSKKYNNYQRNFQLSNRLNHQLLTLVGTMES